MEPIAILSEVVIEALKEFAKGKRPVNATTLQEALCAREEIHSLIPPALHAAPDAKRSTLEPGKESGRVPLGKPGAGVTPDSELLSEMRKAFLKILESLGPAINGNHENQFRELRKRITKSKSLTSLSWIGEQIGLIVKDLTAGSAKHIDYSNDFLAVLSENLLEIEEQLSIYQNYNRETHQISSDFNNNLYSQTNDMHHAFDAGDNLKDVRLMIATKLSAILKAIEVKNQSDEHRLKEADAKIAELQNNLQAYNKEIRQVRERADSLEKEVLLDELTQISNRRAFDLQIRENLRRYHENKEKFSLILMDIDHFKKINDEYGHKAGDKCLQEIAKLVKSALRRTDFVARYGGEELIAILHGCDVENAQNFAEKIRMRIERTMFCFQGKTVPVTISLGVTEALPGDVDTEIPFIRVDQAMYKAKEAGRNRVFAVTGPALPEMPGEKSGSAANRSWMN